jgi:DNA processing protein
MGVDVAVVPGSIHDPLVAGGLGLIRQGAALVRSPQEWLADLGIVCPSGQAKGSNPAMPVAAASLWSSTEDDRATALWQFLKASPQGIDELCATSGRSAADAQAGLLILELQGRAFRTPSGQWQRFSGPGVF